MPNRKQRRDARKKMSRYQRLTTEQKANLLYKNGITAKDLSESYESGYNDGLQDATRAVYAAAALAAHREYGFAKKRAQRLLKGMDAQMLMSIDFKEMVQRAEKELHYKIVFKGYDPIEGRVQDK